MGCVGAWSLHPSQIDDRQARVLARSGGSRLRQKIVAAMPDGAGAVMIDGKMQDDATWKQAKVLARPRRAWSPPRIPTWRRATALTDVVEDYLDHDEQNAQRQVQDRSGGASTACIPFRGVVFDIDPVFNNTEEWWQSIPAEVRPHKDQPFYHLFAENAGDRIHRLCVGAESCCRIPRAQPIRHPECRRGVRAATKAAATGRATRQVH